MDKIRVVVIGPDGKKLGEPVCGAILASKDLELFAKIVRPGTPRGLREDVLLLHESFSTIRRSLTVESFGLSASDEQIARAVVFYAVKADALDDRLYDASANGYCRYVIGTTGLTPAQKDKIYHLSTTNTIVYAPNFSIEAVLLGALSGIAGRVLSNHEVEIDETHHHGKKDQPSGTAKSVAEKIALARGQKPADVIQYGWPEQIAERRADIINIASHRAGKVPGEHTVSFYGEFGNFSLVQSALSSGGFAAGALQAIRWCANNDLIGRVFGMEDVLGLADLA
jgi:4-hydroxy-tetrahydrodipicolinate reductase